MISIKSLDKAAVLAALYNNASPLGLGFLHATPEDMTIEQARSLLNETKYFDYLKGRVLKVNLTDDNEFNERLYDRDNGIGSAEDAINSLKNIG